jgi:hypothetical protein
MSILDDILNAIGLGKKPAPAPAPKSPPPAAPRSPASPPASAPATLQLSALKAQNTAPVGSAEINAAAARLGDDRDRSGRKRRQRLQPGWPSAHPV